MIHDILKSIQTTYNFLFTPDNGPMLERKRTDNGPITKLGDEIVGKSTTSTVINLEDYIADDMNKLYTKINNL